MDDHSLQMLKIEQEAFGDALGLTHARANPKDPKDGLPISGGTSDDVKTIQSKLKALGYMSVVTGTWGGTTTTAVRSFQTDYDLPITGSVDRVTWDLLMAKGGGAKATNILTDVASFATGLFGPPAPPAEAASLPATTQEEDKDNTALIVGGIAAASVLLIGGIILLTRD
jgi:peptidoglycan hydrolase-like protein with peptidoglycan-binding domain